MVISLVIPMFQVQAETLGNLKAKLAKEKPNVLNTIYGMAPWNAMNQGISEYNKTTVGKKYPCIMKYSMVGDAYTNSYPTLDK